MRQSDLEKEHEAFKSRLVHDVLGQETGDKVPMEKVVMLIWQFRGDKEVVTFMSRFAAKYAGSRHVFDGIEFYLPQLAHMIIHLEAEWDDEILERFALIIAQQSLHFALQLNWILQGALQDYQPEDAEGNPNPNYNQVFYMRCQQLLKNVERCVVYGKPRAQELQRLYEKGKITKKEMILMEQADRRFNAQQIMAADDDDIHSEKLDGWLYVQPPQKDGQTEASISTMEYRFCVLERNILNLFKNKSSCVPELVLDRAMIMEGAQVEEAPRNNGIQIKTPRYSFSILCSSPEERNLWKRRLAEEAQTSALFQSRHTSSFLKKDMTAAQLNRYEFFEDERNFVTDIVQIAESLRFEERADRKLLAPGKMEQLTVPRNVYLPLCNSSDIWRRVVQAMPSHTRVFNTKERCPTVMHFLSRRGERSPSSSKVNSSTMDVAEYMHNCFDIDIGGEMEAVEETDEAEEGGKAESVNGNDNDEVSNLRAGASKVWDDDEEETAHPSGSNGPGAKNSKGGNKKVQRLLRESVVALPQVLSKRIQNQKNMSRRKLSIMDRQTEMQPMVSILEGNEDRTSQGVGIDDDEISVVSVETSSIIVKDQVVIPNQKDGDIDAESLQRATRFICGGQSWAAKSAAMLEECLKESKDERDSYVQTEILSCLAKSYDDLRQEVFVMQMIHYYKSVFAQAKLPLWLKTYRILSTDSATGLLELLTDATSLDALKKSEGYPTKGGLRAYFEMVYGGPDSKSFKAAQTNFTQSLAAYSLVSYFLGLKDRHNGNIMIDTRGRIIFIDFGFAFGMKPGHEFSFEQAPFKFTKEHVQVMGGVGSECYKEFERLFVEGFLIARKNSQIALGLVEIMMYKSNYPCFSGWRYGKGQALIGFEKRLMLRVPDSRVRSKALRLIRKSRGHAGTYMYDAFQKATNGYAI